MSKKLVLSGTIIQGLGEGTFYMSMEHYRNEIKKKLGFNAYPGTLNLKVAKNQQSFLKKIVPIKIDGYKSCNRIFGGANCYKAQIKNISGSIIVPDLARHKDVIEFIAPVHLKSELKISNGDKVKIELIK